MLTFFDPLYGEVTANEFESSLLLLPEVQRLRYVRLCNINSLLVSGASETRRFEHTVGVMKLAQVWLQGRRLVESQARHVVAAAVLHDFQTPPFGHSLQYILEDNEEDFDDRFEHSGIDYGHNQRFYQRTAANCSFAGYPFGARDLLGNLWSEVADTIDGRGVFSPLIASDVDIDNIDNVIRLAFHTGLAHKQDATHAVAAVEQLDMSSNGRLVTSEQYLDFFVRWLEIREALYKLLLLNWAEFSAKAMLTRAVELAVDIDGIGVEDWTMTDDELLATMQYSKSMKSFPEISSLARDIRVGRLLCPVVLAFSADVAAYQRLAHRSEKRKIEEQLARKFFGRAKRANKLIFHPILDRGKTNRKIALVLKENGQLVNLGHDSSRILIGIFSGSDDALTIKRNWPTKKLLEFVEESTGVRMNGLIDEPVSQQGKQLELL